MEKHFSLPHIGNLFLEHSFYMLEDEPILFVCKGPGETRFLCSCCRLYEKWVVGQVSEENLLNLIDDKVTIRGVIENCDTKFVVKWDGKAFGVHGDVPESILPKEGALLELDGEKTGAYREFLVKKKKERQSLRAAIQHSKEALAAWERQQQAIFTGETYRKMLSVIEENQAIYAKFLREWAALEPVISEMEKVISSATISVRLAHINWANSFQFENSLSSVSQTGGERMLKKIVVKEQTDAADTDRQNQAVCDDEIQYLAA